MSGHSLSNPPPLEPCPFCGGPATLTETHGEGYSIYGRYWYTVGCERCECTYSDREEFQFVNDRHVLKYPAMECVERWNKRPSSAAPQMLTALKTVMQHGRIDDSEERMNMVAAAIIAAEGAPQ